MKIEQKMTEDSIVCRAGTLYVEKEDGMIYVRRGDDWNKVTPLNGLSLALTLDDAAALKAMLAKLELMK